MAFRILALSHCNPLSMYEYMFEMKIATLLAAIAVTWLAGIWAGNPRVSMRSIAFNFGPSFACAFFVVGFFYDGQVSTLDLAAGLLFEFSVLLAFTKLFRDLLKPGDYVDNCAVERWLRVSLLLQLLVVLPIMTSDGFGIFSDGSRIAFLENNGAAKYFVYAGILILAVQAGLVAQRLSIGRTPGVTGYAVIVSVFAISTLSGSKGVFFLWLASTLSLIDYRNLRIRLISFIAGVITVAAAFVVTANFMSEILGISGVEFAKLGIARFFLNNDARALAFDYGGTTEQLSELLSASFRFFSIRLGYEPLDPPIGFLLHEKLYGISTGTGANASLIALVVYYSMPGFALFPAIIACVSLAVVYSSVVGFRRMVVGPIRKGAVTIIGITLVQMFSQDFLAFQLLVPLAGVAGLFFLVPERKYARANLR